MQQIVRFERLKVVDVKEAETQVDATIEELYRAHFPALMRVAFVLTGSNETAEDVVHDVFVRSVARLDNVENPSAYLRAGVVNACRSHHRALAARQRNSALTASEPRLDAELVELRDALGALSIRRRSAVVLRYLCDLDDTEIAELLGCRPATVRSLVHRGLAQLKEAIT